MSAVTEKDLTEIEAQIDSTVPYYVPSLIAAIRLLTRERDEARALIGWIDDALRGIEVSDFAQSFAHVQMVIDLRADLQQARAETIAADALTQKKLDEMGMIWHQNILLKRRAEKAEAERDALTAALTEIVDLNVCEGDQSVLGATIVAARAFVDAVKIARAALTADTGKDT